jgi:hypothetical protein
MADALLTLVQAIPGLAKLAGEIIAASDKAKSNAQLIEFQQALIGLNALVASVQQENATVLRQKGEAEDKLKRMEDWDAEKQRYKLATPYSGVTVFALKKDMNEGEPPHYLCANCFKKGVQAHLAHSTNKDGWVSVVCSECRFAAQTRWRGLGPPKYAEEITPEG